MRKAVSIFIFVAMIFTLCGFAETEEYEDHDVRTDDGLYSGLNYNETDNLVQLHPTHDGDVHSKELMNDIATAAGN